MEGDLSGQNAIDVHMEPAMQSRVADALAELSALWQTFGLSEREQLQEQTQLIATVEKCCRAKVETWRDQVTTATARVTALEKEVQRINGQLQGKDSVGWCVQSLDQLCSGALRDRLAALEVEFELLDRVRARRLADVERLHDHLGRMDKKLGTTSELPSGPSTLSEEYKETLHDMIKRKSREVYSRRAALLGAVSECVELARELQIETKDTFAHDLTARLKKREMSTDMLEKIFLRTAELRGVKDARKLRLTEKLGQIHDLWRELKISDEEQERFRLTIHGVGKATIASCDAELIRLQRHHKRFAAIVVQVATLRNAITEYWNLLGYESDDREYFTTTMTTPDSALSYRVFRAHEKEVDRLKKQLSTKRVLSQYIAKREEILQARAKHGVPDEKTRVRIERELPKYTAILANRIAKWQNDTGVVFRYKGASYLELMRTEDIKAGKAGRKTEQAQAQKKYAQQAQANLSCSGGPTDQWRHVQQSNRHSVEEHVTSRLSVTKEQFQQRRSDPQAPIRPRWRKFIRNTFSRHDGS
ncbi:unnamed protein product [Hyaloperonospora brassicae]|uniref:Dynein regulatory complex protein 1/2 N-terminal domain-containing protein n=1 Tax=Hyaloperonospora brassicae TaxID=162125 RepID=A0AAV0TLH5_HYABA|nr:unnamed protein product [Hyaloperonospora brassicae]